MFLCFGSESKLGCWEKGERRNGLSLPQSIQDSYLRNDKSFLTRVRVFSFAKKSDDSFSTLERDFFQSKCVVLSVRGDSRISSKLSMKMVGLSLRSGSRDHIDS